MFSLNDDNLQIPRETMIVVKLKKREKVSLYPSTKIIKNVFLIDSWWNKEDDLSVKYIIIFWLMILYGI